MATAKIKQHVPIFISSTFEDLIPYREEVQRVLVRLEQIVKGMEFFGSNPQNSLDTCLKQIKESRVYIGIIGMKYGSIEEKSSLSYTQLEYQEAINCHIPTLIYIIDENHPIPSKFVDVNEKALKLSDFKNILKKNHTVSFFTTPADLGAKISRDLIDTLSSLDQVEVEEIEETKNDVEFLEIYKKFTLRPAKYAGFEGTLTMKLMADFIGISLKEQIVSAYGLSLGDTISAKVLVYNTSIENMIPFEKEISIYADGERADWLEGARKGNIITANVRLSFCTIKETNNYDSGVLLKETTYYGLTLTRGITISNNYS